jgi:hypothetical protein
MPTGTTKTTLANWALGRAILAVDVPLEKAFEFAQSGSRRKIQSMNKLLDEERPVEMLVDHETAMAAQVIEGDLEEGV